MSAWNSLGLGALVCVGLVAGAGCSSDDSTAQSGGDYDYSSLDQYMSDAKQVPVSFSNKKSRTSKGSDRSDSQEYDGFLGDWVADLDFGDDMSSGSGSGSEMGEAGEEFAAAMVEAFSSMLSMSLTVEDDQSFSMTMMSMPIKGSWEHKGEFLVLTPEEFMGMSVDQMAEYSNGSSDDMKPLELRISDDGSSLTATNPDEFDTEELVFKRKS